MLKILPDLIKFVFKLIISLLGILVFTAWFLIVFDMKDAEDFYEYLWSYDDLLNRL